MEQNIAINVKIKLQRTKGKTFFSTTENDDKKNVSWPTIRVLEVRKSAPINYSTSLIMKIHSLIFMKDCIILVLGVVGTI